MNIKLFLFALLSFSLMAPPVSAEEFYIQGSLALSDPDAGSDSELTSTTAPRIIAGFIISPNFSAEVGYYYLYTEQDEEKEDVISQYKVDITSQDILLGLKGQFNINKTVSLYSRSGLLLWNTELELTERFWGTIPEGSRTADDNGIGYYLSAGMTLHFTSHLYMDLYLSHQRRDGILKEDSDFPIDITETSSGVGLGYTF